jgi:hypothetical protein
MKTYYTARRLAYITVKKMIPVGPQFHKPKSIIAAKNILYASLFMGVLAVIVRDSRVGLPNNGGILAALLTAIGLLLVIFLIKIMNQCKKWARIVLVVFYGLFLLAFVNSLFYRAGQNNIVEDSLFGLQIILVIVAMFFLFSRPSTIWFNKDQSDQGAS